MESKEDKAKKKKKYNRFGILLLLAIILCASAQMFGEIQNYVDSEENYDEVEKHAVEKRKNNAKDENAAALIHNRKKKTQAPISVDFESVKNHKEGNNVIGWLYVEAVEISYPILQGSSNDQYLKKNLDGEYDISGSVFMDSENSSDFSDPNTIIFGHNMADGSMFGKLKQFSLKGALQTSPYVWVITEQSEYCYQIFSVQVAEVTDECYTLFSSRGEKFVDFLKRMRRNSTENTGEFEFYENDDILTLSTCNGSNTSSRYVIQAKKIQ